MRLYVRIREGGDVRTREQINRGAAIEQDRADIRLEAQWRAAVSSNIARKRVTNSNYARVA